MPTYGGKSSKPFPQFRGFLVHGWLQRMYIRVSCGIDLSLHNYASDAIIQRLQIQQARTAAELHLTSIPPCRPQGTLMEMAVSMGDPSY
jgi:hypothetical protein